LETFRQSFLYKYSNSSSHLTAALSSANRREIEHCPGQRQRSKLLPKNLRKVAQEIAGRA